MTTLELEKKWLEIGPAIHGSFRSMKIATDCLCDLYVGFNSDQNRSLILSMTDIPKAGIRDELKDHVGLRFFDQSGHLVITLFHEEFKELFNDLIISIYNKIKGISDNKSAAREMLACFRTWCEFFYNSGADKLSKDEIQGIFGEMFYLRDLLNHCNKNEVNDILRSWTGPYNKGQDFIFGKRNVEIKTKDVSQIEVTISSEYQLLEEIGKELHLHVLSVESYSGQGQNLRELLNDIRLYVNDLQGDVSILFKALKEKEITVDSVAQYDNFKFNPCVEYTYDCCLDRFPRLTQHNIDPQIKKVKYSLRLTGLETFIIHTKDY